MGSIRRSRSIRGLVVLLFALVGARHATAESLTLSTLEGSVNALVAEAVLREAYGRLGITLNVESYEAKDALRLASIGRTDGELQRVRAVGDDHPTLRRVKVPLLTLTSFAYAVKPDIHIANMMDLTKYRVGSIRGVRYATDLLTEVGADAVFTRTGAQLFTLLQADRVDVVISTRLSASAFWRQAGVRGVRVVSPALVSVPLYHYLHESKASLVPRIEGVLKDMRERGEIRAICAAVEKQLGEDNAR